MAQQITLMRGDGIGPEIMDAALFVLEATKIPFIWDEQPAGASAAQQFASPLPPQTLSSLRQNRWAFKSPLETPVGGGYRSVNVALRQEFDLYANVRPVRTFPGVKSRYDNIDLVVIRENTQGLYSGIEFYTDNHKNSAQAISLITRPSSERVIRYAFEYCRQQRRKKLTLVHKANILKLTTGLFLEVGRELSAQYPDVEFTECIVDAMAMNLVIKPQAYDVIVTTNLFGDILSDLTAGLVGGLGLAPSANIGEDVQMFEAIHGTAPDIAGKGIANPTALILSGAMMLHSLGHHEEAARIEASVEKVLSEQKIVTPDLGGKASTMDYAKAVIANL